MGTKYVIDESTLIAIADSIREKTGGEDSLTPAQMASEILNISGTEDLNAVLTEQDALIEELKEVLRRRASGGGGGTPTPTQEKTIDITENGTHEVTPDEGYALSKVTANVNVPIPDGYIKPSGTKDITSNGTHSVTEYDSVSVEVPIPDGYVVPSGTLDVTENGAHDVTEYASVNVNVPSEAPNIQSLEITENGTYTAPDGVDGYSPITVNVASGSTEPEYKALYQRVEYIESSEEGTYPYVITDIYADNDVGVEIIGAFPVLQDRVPMGSRQDNGTTRFYVVYPMSANSVYYGFGSGSSVSCALKVDTIYRLQTNFLNSRLVCVYEQDGTRKANASLSATLTPHTAPISIFGYNSGTSGTVTSKREYKLYSARISKGHEVIRHYIPCYRKSDGVVGLYEKFSGQFLAADEGSFAHGDELEWETVGG